MRRLRPDDGGQYLSRPTRTQEERESRAYVLLEETRLRCERFEDHAPQLELRLIHREIGMAGLFASAEIQSWSRQLLLEAARLRSESPIPGAHDAVGALEVALGRACTQVEHCLTAAAPADHMHLAHVHVLGAIDVLNAWLSGPRLVVPQPSEPPTPIVPEPRPDPLPGPDPAPTPDPPAPPQVRGGAD